MSATQVQTAQNGAVVEKNKIPEKGYGGNSKAGWVGSLPSSWVPYVQLARLSPPAGLFLIYFPHAFGVLHGAILRRVPVEVTVRAAVVSFAGSFFLSNAIHIWNDLVDAPLDAKVERTKNRPIPRGAVSPGAAFVYTVTQAVGAAAFFPLTTPSDGGFKAAILSIPSIIGWIYYPYAKRHTNFPQTVLGFCLAWGVVMGSLTVGVDPLGGGPGPLEVGKIDPSATGLFVACVLWTMIYDTIYAHQDLEDDLKAGIKSLAVLYKDNTKSLLWQLLSLLGGALIGCGYSAGMGAPYYAISAGGAVSVLGTMIAKVDLKDSDSCWWWFGKGFWFAGGAIVSGLLAEYMTSVVY